MMEPRLACRDLSSYHSMLTTIRSAARCGLPVREMPICLFKISELIHPSSGLGPMLRFPTRPTRNYAVQYITNSSTAGFEWRPEPPEQMQGLPGETWWNGSIESSTNATSLFRIQNSVIWGKYRGCVRQFNSRFLAQPESDESFGSIRHTKAMSMDLFEQVPDDVS